MKASSGLMFYETLSLLTVWECHICDLSGMRKNQALFRLLRSSFYLRSNHTEGRIRMQTKTVNIKSNDISDL